MIVRFIVAVDGRVGEATQRYENLNATLNDVRAWSETSARTRAKYLRLKISLF